MSKVASKPSGLLSTLFHLSGRAILGSSWLVVEVWYWSDKGGKLQNSLFKHLDGGLLLMLNSKKIYNSRLHSVKVHWVDSWVSVERNALVA